MQVDANQLWDVINKIQQSTNIMNNELGVCKADIAWLKASWWELINWIRVIGGGVVVGIVLSVWNLVVIKKNNKK